MKIEVWVRQSEESETQQLKESLLEIIQEKLEKDMLFYATAERLEFDSAAAFRQTTHKRTEPAQQAKPFDRQKPSQQPKKPDAWGNDFKPKEEESKKKSV